MWLTTVAMLLGTQVTFLEPVAINSDFKQISDINYLSPQNIHRETFLTSAEIWQGKVAPTNDNPLQTTQAKRNFIAPIAPIAPIDVDKNTIEPNNSAENTSEQPDFKAGFSSWETPTLIGSLGFNGKFDKQAHLTKGNAFWKTDTDIGSLGVTAKIDDRFEFSGASASWQAKTILGSVAINGNFDKQTTYKGAMIRSP